MRIMELIAKAMTDEQIRSVSRYYASVRPSEADRGQSRQGAAARPSERSGDAAPQAIRVSPILTPAKENLLGLPDSSRARPPYLNPADAARGAAKPQKSEGK
jgi:hypothetical protein